MIDWIVTVLALCGSLALAVLASWKSGQPWNELKPRLVPWRLVMLLSAFAAILAIVHAVNLIGFQTGPEHAVFGRF